MIKDLFKLSCIGWNVFLHGSFKQRLIAHMAMGAIVGGTRAGIESATGIREKRREEEARRRREMDLKLYKLNVDVSNDLRKEVEKSIEETVPNRIDNLGKMIEDVKKSDSPKMDDLERITQELIQVYREYGL